MQTINLDIANKGIAQPINAKQGDVGRKFKILIFENGIPYDITSNAALFSMWYSGPSGDGNYDTIWISDSENQTEGRYAFDVIENSVIVEMASQMLKNPGDGQMCVTMKNSNGNIIGLWNIPYIVELVPGYPSEETKPYYPHFVRTVNGVTPDENGNVEVEAVSANCVSYAPQSLTPEQQAQARENIDALKIPREIVKELFWSVDENDFQTQGDLNVFKFNEVLGWLQSPEDFDFRIRFSVRINIATVEEYEFTKADCRIEATAPSGRWRFYAATSQGGSTHVLTIANGISLVGSDSENSCSIAYPSEFENFTIELYRIENTERELKLVTSVNDVEPDENGNVRIDVGGYSKTLLWQDMNISMFETQELRLPNDEYDAIEIVHKSAIDDPCVSTTGAIPLVVGYSSYCCLRDIDGTVRTMVSVRRNDTDTVHELEFWFNVEDAEVCPPCIIYGIKY